MEEIALPSWDLLCLVRHKKSVKTLDQIQEDDHIQEFAKPVLLLIEKAFKPPVTNHDVILGRWRARSDRMDEASKLNKKIRSMTLRAGMCVFNRMSIIDSELEELMTKTIECTWFQIKDVLFEKGPEIVCYPKQIQEALLTKSSIDPSPFDESALFVTEPEENPETSQMVIETEEIQENMETVQVLATNSP